MSVCVIWAGGRYFRHATAASTVAHVQKKKLHKERDCGFAQLQYTYDFIVHTNTRCVWLL